MNSHAYLVYVNFFNFTKKFQVILAPIKKMVTLVKFYPKLGQIVCKLVIFSFQYGICMWVQFQFPRGTTLLKTNLSTKQPFTFQASKSEYSSQRSPSNHVKSNLQLSLEGGTQRTIWLDRGRRKQQCIYQNQCR